MTINKMEKCFKCGEIPACSKPYEKDKPMECCNCKETKSCINYIRGGK